LTILAIDDEVEPLKVSVDQGFSIVMFTAHPLTIDALKKSINRGIFPAEKNGYG